MGFPRPFVIAATAAALLLAGCPSSQQTASPAGRSSQAQAPALTEPQAAAGKEASAEQAAGQEALPGHRQAAAASNPEIQELIGSVEASYQKGVHDYGAGRMASARDEFNHAVDLMLTSRYNIRSNPQLSDEFDRIVDAVNTLEMEALKQGNGFAPKVEPSPVDVANDVTFPVDPNIKAQAIAELKTTHSDLPLVINDPVASYINYFSTRGRGTLERSLERAGKYRAMISRILRKQGVPQDLIYQAVAESGFQPRAVHGSTGARGMWQFMPYDSYGLARNGWYDERFDPEKSTIAYANYMKTLYNQLGDWYLAMAAYDWGAGNVQRAVERTGYADFWELYKRNVLPQETKNYVPIIIAAAIMAKNPKQYGLESVVPDPPLVTDTVTTDYSVSLQLVADMVNAPMEQIVALNPSLLRMSTPPGEDFDLHLPAGTKALFEQRIAEIPVDKRGLWRYHRLDPGDTLASVAKEFHVSAQEIAFVNQLDPGDGISGEDALIIPVHPARSVEHTSRYRVRRGDTIVTIADRFNVTVKDLRRWNRLRSNRVESGHYLYVAEPAHISHRHHSTRTEKKTRASRGRHASVAKKTSRHESRHATTASKRKKKRSGRAGEQADLRR